MEELSREPSPKEIEDNGVEESSVDNKTVETETDIDETLEKETKSDLVSDDNKDKIIETSETSDVKNNDSSPQTILEIQREEEPVIKDERSSDSDTNSNDPSNNTDQIETNASSQFYESSDSKVDYAVKCEDNDTLSDIDDIKTDSACADSEDSALGSLPSDPDPLVNDREEEGQDRSDGSDSGLGSETTEEGKSSNFGLDLPGTSDQSIKDETKDNPETITATDYENNVENANEVLGMDIADETNLKEPLKSSLKRRHETESEDEPQAKKKKQGIRFDNVRVYYFPRSQGFSCVPSQGGSTLGMEWKHSHTQDFSIVEHAVEQRRLHRTLLQQLKSEHHLIEGVALSSSDESDTEEEASDISESELDLDSYYFLQPVPTRQRRALLRAAGVRKIEGYEKNECRDIRASREFCGCACKGSCNPETCSCSLAGIKCQVDRLSFPCGCTRDACKNTTGRIEFNPIRVRTHFIHTLMRLGLEKKNEEAQAAANQRWTTIGHAMTAATPTCITNVPYPITCQNTNEDGLRREINLTPIDETESCTTAGRFNNHCNSNSSELLQSNNIQEQVNYRHRCDDASFRNTNDALQISETAEMRNHVNPYTASILQGKGPPYTAGNSANFDAVTQNVQRFPCDLNYYHLNEHQHFKHLQSFSASSFEEFVHNHNSHMSVFNNYGHAYSSDYLNKQKSAVNDHNSLQYHQATPNHYDMYINNSEVASASKVEGYYAPLVPTPYVSDKSQNVENDENWFSHNTLTSLDQNQTTAQPAQDAASTATAVASDDAAVAAAEAPTPSEGTSEPTENFGELIKNTMVESVSV